MSIKSVSCNYGSNVIQLKNREQFLGSTEITLKSIYSYKNADMVNAADLSLINYNPYPKAKSVRIISFGSAAEAGEKTGKAVCRGMWMHIAHLPAERSFIGQWLDPETNKFIEFLHKSRQTHWIMNPLTTLGEDLCPYSSPSRFDRNKYIVNLNKLTEKKYGSLLNESELPDDIPSNNFTLDMLKAQKDSRFEKAYERFKKLADTHPLKQEFAKFQDENKFWLEDNAIYEGISNFLNKVGCPGVSPNNFTTWPDTLKFFPENTKGMSFDQKLNVLKKIKVGEKQISDNELDKIGQFKFEQFLFDKQFKEQKEVLNKYGISLFVDLAYSVNPAGKDVWAHKNIVELDSNLRPKRITGCMPEGAIPNTQLWHNAVWNYDSPDFWRYQEESMTQMLKEGRVRIDHFGGFVNRGAIPAVITENGKTYNISDAIKPIEEGGLGTSYWRDEWLEDVSKKTNELGENLIDLYIRLAKENGLNPAQTFIVEDLGGVCCTQTFSEFMTQYKDKLAGLRLPYTYGIDTNLGKNDKDIGSAVNVHNPYLFLNDKHVENIALVSQSHDSESLMGVVEKLLKNKPEAWDGKANSPFHFRCFAKNQLKFVDSELNEVSENSIYNVTRKCLEWLYSRPARHVHTTISDALGLYFRPNIPGKWNGERSKFLMNPDEQQVWNTRFSKGFLERDCESGINAGYKNKVDNFINFMQNLFGKPE